LSREAQWRLAFGRWDMAAAWTADGRDMERTSSVDPPSGGVLVDWRRDLERSGGVEIWSGAALSIGAVTLPAMRDLERSGGA
jgi:hypothetical protein